MKKLALSLSVLFLACGQADREPTGEVRSSFESAEAVLVDVELDGHLRAATADPSAVGSLISTQLLYTVGPLNADRSVGSYSALVVSGVKIAPSGNGQFDVSYHAKLPVAWGAGDIPSSYEFVLPRAVGNEDQIAFSRAYAPKCADPEGGIQKDEDAGRMFLFLRPQQAGCVFDTNDIVRVSAQVTRTSDTGVEKYPEYRRIWSDRTLRAVYVFSIEEEDAPTDAGRAAYDHFVERVEMLLGATASKEARQAHIETTYPDGRSVQVDAALVGTYMPSEPPAFDAWFNGVTPSADLVMYAGHAGLGANVRALSKKGSFHAGQYVIWAMNGCDTFAYADRTLADRRVLLNPDDPSGTKYMDQVSNALGAWFHAGDDTAVSFLSDLVEGRKSYRQMLSVIDPSQVVVVTGEEDNEDPPPSGPTTASASTGALSIPVGAPAALPNASRNTSSCAAVSGPSPGPSWAALLLVGLCLVAMRRRD